MRNSTKLGYVIAGLALAGSAMDSDHVASAKRARKAKASAPAKSTAAPAEAATAGSVFQGIMNDAERHKSGAHYTAHEDIMRIVGPTSFGIIQSGPHWEWTKAKGGKVRADIRYTNEVWTTFPWPQEPREEEVVAVAAAGRELRRVRAELMHDNGWSLRALYQAAEVPGPHPLKDAQAALDEAVRRAYGMPEGQDANEFLLELNKLVAEDEAEGRTVQDVIADRMRERLAERVAALEAELDQLFVRRVVGRLAVFAQLANQALRDNLRRARALLAEAGWTYRDGALRNAKGEAFTIEFLDNSGSMGRIVTPFARNLEKLGIAVNRTHLLAAPLGPNQGRGIAAGFWFNIGGESSAAVHVDEDGGVTVVSSNPDIGGSRASMAIMAAETLGLPIERVRATVADTTSIGYSGSTGGSRVTFATGMAVVDKIAKLPIVDASAIQSVMTDLPMANYTVGSNLTRNNVVRINSFTEFAAKTGVTDSERIFGYLEKLYPQYLPPENKVTGNANGYVYRFFPNTGAYIGTKDNQVWYLVPSLSSEIKLLGTVADYLAKAVADNF